jgi:hypothetical protein
MIIDTVGSISVETLSFVVQTTGKIFENSIDIYSWLA